MRKEIPFFKKRVPIQVLKMARFIRKVQVRILTALRDVGGKRLKIYNLWQKPAEANFVSSKTDIKLAIFGGPKAVTIEKPEQWKSPKEEEKRIVCELIEKTNCSGAGRGLPKEFEEDVRDFVGSKYCLSVDHGTTALASAYYAVGVGPGDEVITPAAGFIGSYAGALHLGARPVFCDIDPKTLQIDPNEVALKVTPRTRAINAVHLHGRVCNMDALMKLGHRYNIPIVNDAAHALGAEWNGKMIGNVGDITCFSLQGLYPKGKPASGGEGGVVTTNNREFYERQLIYCHLHRSGIFKEYTYIQFLKMDREGLGLKFRAHPLALALAKVSLSTLKYRNEKQLENRNRISSAIRQLPGLEPAHDYAKGKKSASYQGLKVIYHPEELGDLSIRKFVEAIKAEGCIIHGPSKFHMEHLRTIFTEGFDLWGNDRGPLKGEWCGLPSFKTYKPGDFPVAESFKNRIITLQDYIDPKEGFIDQYIEAFRKVTSNYKSLV